MQEHNRGQERATSRDEAARMILLAFARFGLVLDKALGESIADLELHSDVLSNSSIAVLIRLDADGPMSPSHLIEITGLTSGGVTKLLDRLEADQLVSRHRGEVEGDARSVVVRVTDRGRWITERLAGAFADHRETVDGLLWEIRDNLDL